MQLLPGVPAVTYSPLPQLTEFGQVLAPSSPAHRTIRKLYLLLASLDAEADHFQREDQLINLAKWIRAGTAVPQLVETAPGTPQAQRVLLLVLALEKFGALRERLAAVVQRWLGAQSVVSFLARLGIPGDRGLFTETIDRLSRRLMPQPIDEEDITELIARMFPSSGDPYWLVGLPTATIVRFVESIRKFQPGGNVGPISIRPMAMSMTDLPLGAMPSLPDQDRASVDPDKQYSVWAPLRAGLLEGILLLASRVSAAGLSDDIRARSPQIALTESPFFLLPRSIDALLATPRRQAGIAAQWADQCAALIKSCREAVSAVLVRLEVQGVSVDVVYRLELIERSLARIEQLIFVLVAPNPEQATHRATNLLASLLGERRRDRSLTDILRTNTRLLARKVIERAGVTGEHYITVTRAEYFKMLLSAMGGGFLTCGTMLLKVFITWLHRPPFQEGLLLALNYGGSFLAMQFLGFTLATKMSSMTGAALAGAFKGTGKIGYDELTLTVARLTRSQLAAVTGNVLMVIPTCIGADYLFARLRGGHVLDETYAHKTLLSLDPFSSGTIPYAALTGVLLWMSSLASGWLENWAVYRRLPEAIEEHRWRRFFGQRTMTWLSKFVARNIAGFGGNAAIGLLLGMTPVIGQFMGLPLDVRHVTLSTGALTLSVMGLGTTSLGSQEVKNAAIGIGLIGMLNVSVSFLLALTVALRARDVRAAQIFNVFWAITKSFFTSPLKFFFPPKNPGPVPSSHVHH